MPPQRRHGMVHQHLDCKKEAFRIGSTSLWHDHFENRWKDSTTVVVKQVLSTRCTLEDAAAEKDIAVHVHTQSLPTSPTFTHSCLSSTAVSTQFSVNLSQLQHQTPRWTASSGYAKHNKEHGEKTVRVYVPRQAKQAFQPTRSKLSHATLQRPTAVLHPRHVFPWLSQLSILIDLRIPATNGLPQCIPNFRP